jgi:monoamine oxidase
MSSPESNQQPHPMPLTGNEAVPPYPFPELEKRYDCIVVGAGIVGAPLAATLGKQGRRVLLIGELQRGTGLREVVFNFF